MRQRVSRRFASVAGIVLLACACDFGIDLTGLTSATTEDNEAGTIVDGVAPEAGEPEAAAPPPLPATAVAAGGSHSCAVRIDGTVVCWGAANRLGNGLVDDSSVPVGVVGVSDAVAVTAGDQHACVTTKRGTVACWGQGNNGQLGLDSTSSMAVAVEVPGLTDVVSVAAGSAFTCALTKAGTVSCWGLNDSGQLGLGSTENKFHPTAVPGLEGVGKIAVGVRHACAIAGGAAQCWGANDRGQLGTGATSTPVLSPQPVVGDLHVTEIAAGADFTCAIADGARQCWGYNVLGALGTGNAASPATSPMRTPHTGMAALAAGGSTGCALEADGTVSCWGNARAGQLGNGAPLAAGEYLTTATPIPNLSGVTSISVGASHACALLKEGRVRCWGYNGNGRLGIGTPLDAVAPVRVALDAGASDLIVGPTHACAVLSSGVTCWGNNGSYQLSPSSTNPVVATGTPIPVDGRVRAVWLGNGMTCLADSDDHVVCFGNNSLGALGVGSSSSIVMSPTAYGGPTSPTSVRALALPAGSGAHSCALVVDAGPVCTGNNLSGQLGTGETLPSTTKPRPVSPMPFTAPIAYLAAGSDFSCAASADGVACWGADGNGRLGDGASSSSQRSAPWPVLDAGVKALALGSSHACVVMASDAGDVRCWGRNAEGQVGDGTIVDRSSPTGTRFAHSAIQIVAGARHTCALLADDAGVECWGENRYGQLGNATHTFATTPTTVAALSGVVQLGAGNETTCARLATGEVFCWGRNADGQLGDGRIAVAFSPMPVKGFE